MEYCKYFLNKTLLLNAFSPLVYTQIWSTLKYFLPLKYILVMYKLLKYISINLLQRLLLF